MWLTVESSINSFEKTVKSSDTDGRQLLLYDPDLPFGWKRIINSNNSSGKLQVHIIRYFWFYYNYEFKSVKYFLIILITY